MRKENWDTELAKYLSDNETFDWTQNNCALFAAGAVIAQTGIDYAGEYRGPKTKLGIIKRLKRIAGDVEEAATKELGEPISVKLAKRGDVVSHEMQEGMALGVCLGVNSVFINETGKVFIRTTACNKAWRI